MYCKRIKHDVTEREHERKKQEGLRKEEETQTPGADSLPFLLVKLDLETALGLLLHPRLTRSQVKGTVNNLNLFQNHQPLTGS